MSTILSDLRRLTEAVRAARVDIAPTYREYVQLAFAIATDCGEAGRSDFLMLCSQSAKYDPRGADKLFSNALKTNKNDVHIGTAFHLAEVGGVKPEHTEPEPMGTVGTQSTAHNSTSHTHVRAYNNVENAQPEESTDYEDCQEAPLKGSEPLTPLPTFDSRVQWPAPLDSIVRLGATPAQKDVLLLGAVTVLGATMNSHVRCSYGGKMISPCLQTFVVALPASGKGVLSLIRLLAEPIHDEIRRQVEEAVNQYRKEKVAYDVMGKERAQATQPVMPRNSMLLISGNNTGTGILENLMDSNGIGLICESEADTISTAIGSDYGHWSDTMRKAFDHDRLSYNRRTDHEYREVKKSYLSVLLSGTPAQIKPLIPTAENGLFSRQIFYYMPAIHKWQDQFDQQDANLEEIFTVMGIRWKEKVQSITLGGLFTLSLTTAQKEQFNRLFENLFSRSGLTNGNEMSSSVARLAINICRMMEVVSMLRVLESENLSDSPYIKPDKEIPADNLKDGIVPRWDISISPDDFDAVLGLAEKLYCHTTHILSFLPDTEIVRRVNSDRDALLQSMETEFTRNVFLQKAEELGIKVGTAITWLKRLTKNGTLQNMDGKGTYRKRLYTDA